MSTDVFYFSGTGNCLITAKKIAENTGGNLKSIAVAVRDVKVETDARKIVIVFPVYAWGPPVLVRRFVRKIADIRNKKVYVVTTFGGSAGATEDFILKDIEKKGGKVAAGLGIRMPGNCITLYGAWPEGKQNKFFERFQERIKVVSDYIAQDKEGLHERSNFFINLVFSGLIYKAFISGLPNSDKKFRATDKCTSCGICQRVCPAENIELMGGKPRWMGSCEQCMACIQWCPEEAIQHGKKTIERKRYRHPEITLQDMYDQAGKQV
jgi:ferredoxin